MTNMGLVDLIVLFGMSFLYGLTGAMMPGPVTTMTINETLKYSRKRPGFLVGIAVASGHAILEMGLMIALWLGASVVFSYPLVLLIIGLAGGISVIIFGLIGMYKVHVTRDELIEKFENIGKAGNTAGNEGKIIAVDEATPQQKILWRALSMGFIMSATSSGWWGWWASLGLNSITVLDYYVFGSIAVFLAFYMGHIASDYAWFTFVSGVVSIGRKRLKGSIFALILQLTHVFLIVLGCIFMVISIQKFV